MVPENITRNDIINAINRIDEQGIPSDASSDYYDVVYEKKNYPPKLAISWANVFANCKELDRSTFDGGLNTECFDKLDKEGFEIVTKATGVDIIFDQILNFLRQADTPDLKTKQYLKQYRGLQVRVSFGQAIKTDIPWIAFLAEGQFVQEGIYPVYLYYMKKRLLILAYGLSETRSPTKEWSLPDNNPTLKEYFKSNFDESPARYGSSFVFKVYQLNASHNFGLDPQVFTADLASIISEYTSTDIKGEDNQQTKRASMAAVKHPLNLIFYGPPGTGKTYHSIQRAAEIISGKSISDYSEAKKIFSNAKGNQVEFITFHQNYSYEDFVQGLKPDTDPAGSGLKFLKRDGIFKQIADRALANLKASTGTQVIIEPTFEQVFDEFFRPLLDETGTIKVQMETKSYSYEITSYNEEQNNFSFTKQSGGSGHTLYVPTLKLFYEQPEYDHIQGLKYYYRPLVKAMHERAQNMKTTVSGEERKRYVLVIDEINRANMSRVFGELITLLEDDKRWGNTHQMEVRLPSNDVFTVPNNLYIIGTMNTADKSIALLDIALRRRFQFEPMYPQPQLPRVQYAKVLESINAQILGKKGADFLIGHAYFMADEGETLDIVSSLNTKVIPLLNEYFYTAKSGTVQQIVETAIKDQSGLTVKPDAYQQLKITLADGAV